MPDTEITLLVMVASAAAGHLERRNAIRQTWAFSLTKVKVIFLLGQGHDQQTKIQSESDIYQDIIQEDFEVSYIIHKQRARTSKSPVTWSEIWSL